MKMAKHLLFLLFVVIESSIFRDDFPIVDLVEVLPFIMVVVDDVRLLFDLDELVFLLFFLLVVDVV